MRFRPALAALVAWMAFGSPALGQGFGIMNLLNPEGSRLFPQSVVYPRHAGKPDPRWKSFEWKYVDRSADGVKYRLYFYDTEKWAASFTLPRIDEQVRTLREKFRYAPTRQFDYALFTSQREFQQANLFFISEGVRGITSTEEATMALPYTGHRAEFDHVSLHEMVHQFQVQKVGDLAKVYAPEALASFPLWFIEGMAEYYSQGSQVDRESRVYLRDLLLHPDAKKGHEMPELFEPGPLNFVMVYKVGQAKIDFFESEFGPGTAQTILESVARAGGAVFFAPQVEKILGVKIPQLEKRWQAYLERYRGGLPPEERSLKGFERIDEAGDTLDLFAVSPNGKYLATRSVDPLAGVTSIRLIDLDNGRKSLTVATDDKPDALSLYFFEVPALAISDDTIAYAAETTSGPEIEVKAIRRDDKNLVMEDYRRIPVHEYDLIQVSHLTLHADGRIAFIGLSPKGWENVYVLERARKNGGKYELRRITDGHYAWKGLAWSRRDGQDVLVGSSDQTGSGAYNVFAVDPGSGQLNRITRSEADQTAPEPAPGGEIVFRSWDSGSSQIHRIADGVETRLTDIETMVDLPQLRGGHLYALGFRSGRYQLFRIPMEKLLSEPVSAPRVTAAPQPTDTPWAADTTDLKSLDVREYKPFSSSGIRISNLGAFLSSGGVAGIAGVASDLMRNYQVQGEFFFLGDIELSTADVFVSSQKGRSTWTVGGYHIAQRRLDSVFMGDDEVRTHIHREYGALGALQYPLGPYTYFDVELRVAGVERRDFSDESLAPQWDRINPGAELLLAPMFRLGYDRVLYEAVTGPLKGYAFMLESDTSIFPGRGSVDERIRFDAAYYVQVVSRAVLAFQGLAGMTIDGLFRNPFFLSSEDFLRAYPFGDDRLFGNYVLAARGELRFPVGELFSFPFLRGLLAYDLGSVFNQAEQIPTHFTSSYTAGMQFNIPPLSLGLLFSWPGAVAPGPQIDAPVIHFTLRYLYL